jgi:hypothetical protein
MLEYRGTFIEKRIITYNDSNKCSLKKLINKYSKFDKIHLLREFSDLSIKLSKTKESIIDFSGIPIYNDFLNYCILNAIKYCNGSKINISSFDIKEILKISFPWYQQGIYSNKDSATEILVKTAYRQFAYQESMSIIARSIYIYNFLWSQKYNNTFNINNAFLKMYGITYEKILFYGMAITGLQRSYFLLSDYKGNFDLKTTIDIQNGDFEKFIELVSMDSNNFINYKGSLLNPILKYPILKTDFIPPDMKEPVFLILSKACLFNKLVYGIYYDLLENNIESDGKNDFKTVFGHVFQDYIGILLKEHFNKWNVIPEIRYKKNKDKIDTVDWFIQRGNNLILVEVKQSSIYLSAKNEGNIDELKKGISQNIIKAVNQLEKTETDIFSKNFDELKQFNKIKNIQKLIIIADPLYFGNMIVNILFDNILINKNIHIINITDFESILELQKKNESLFYLLETKMKDENRLNDFNDFIFKKFGRYNKNNGFLIKYFNKFYKSWNIKPIKQKTINL